MMQVERVDQSAQLLATGWTVRGSNSGGGETVRTCPDRNCGPPSLLYNGYRNFPGGKEQPGRDADPSLSSRTVVKKELYLYFPYGPYGFYRASVPVQGRNLPFLPRSTALPEKLTGFQLVKEFPAFHGTRRFITALTSVRHLSLSWASPIKSIYPNPTSWRSILLLSTLLRLGLPSGLLPSGFPTNNLYTLPSPPICSTCPGHLILLDFITRTILGEEYKSFEFIKTIK